MLAWRSLYPSKPSLLASRTTDAAPTLAASARSATVPNPTDWGDCRIASATRRSAAVSDALWTLIRSATSTGAHGTPRGRVPDRR